MDRQDAKPRRPSLMAGASRPETSGSSPARILADMDGTQPDSAAPRTLPNHRLLILAAVLVGLLGMVWWWQSGRNSTVIPPLTATTGAIDAPATDAVSGSGGGAATIIDEPSPASGATALAAGDTKTAGTGNTDADPLASPFASADPAPASDAPDAGNPFIPAASPSTRTAAAPVAPPAARTGKAKARGSSTGKERDLMATLLGNIKPQKSQPAASELDSLIQTMETSGAKTVATRQPASAAAQPSRSQQIQSNLRECPPANTAKGLKCRQEICAVYAGRDPACPAN